MFKPNAPNLCAFCKKCSPSRGPTKNRKDAVGNRKGLVLTSASIQVSSRGLQSYRQQPYPHSQYFDSDCKAERN